jgi:hypothetical protein
MPHQGSQGVTGQVLGRIRPEEEDAHGGRLPALDFD